MFCNNCGREILKGIRFCPDCGMKIFMGDSLNNSDSVHDVPIKNESIVKGEIKEGLEKSLQIINKIEDFIQKKEEVESARHSIEKQKKEIMEELAPIQMWGFILGIPFSIIVPLLATEGTGLLRILLYGVFYYILFFVIVNPIMDLATKSKKVAKAEEWYRAKIVAIDEQESDLDSNFEAYCNSGELEYARSIVPEEYFDSESVGFFLKMLNERRADNFKEAVNLYEEYLHREYMKNIQMQQLSLQGQQLEETRNLSQNVATQMQEQSAYMKQISHNTRSTARAAKVNAVINLVEGHSQSKKLKRIEKNTR